MSDQHSQNLRNRKNPSFILQAIGAFLLVSVLSAIFLILTNDDIELRSLFSAPEVLVISLGFGGVACLMYAFAYGRDR